MQDHDDDAVRRLLAEARHDQPLPPEVAARLDTLLGQLVEARSQESGVHSLAHRRQRRRGLLLLAAAAAVVAGVVVPTVDQLGSREDTATSAGSTSSDTSSDTSSEAGSSAETQSDTPAAPLAPPAADGLVTLTSAGFDAEVGRATQGRSLGQAGPVCAADPGASYGSGTLVGATYDGTPAVLAYRPPGDPPGGDGRRVDLLGCGSATVIRTTTVPAS